jgi:hypothetical protein
MKRLLLYLPLFLLLHGAYAQCTFENFHKYYFPNSDTKIKTIATSDGGFLTVSGCAYDASHPGTGNGQDIDGIVVKTDACGNTLWKTHHGDLHQSDYDEDIIETPSGDYLVLGIAFWQLHDMNVRIACYGKEGALKWSKLFLNSASPTSIYKQKNSNTYIVGATGGAASARPILFYVNDTGRVLRQKAVGDIKCGLRKLLVPNDTSYLLVCATEDSLVLMETDTAFNLRWVKPLFTDTFGKLNRYFAAELSYDKQSIALAIDIPTTRQGISGKNLLAKISLQGDLLTYDAEIIDTFGAIGYITATPNNGYVLGPFLLYTDSNFALLKYQRIYGAAFRSLIFNPDKSITASGTSYKQDSVWGTMCIIRADSTGKITSVDGSLDKVQHGFTLYPNPATDVLHVEANTREPLQLELINAVGKTIYRTAFNGSTSMDTHAYPQGIYFIRFSSASGQALHTERIVLLK